MQVCQHSPLHSDNMKRTVSKLLARMKFVNCNIFLFICSLHLLHGQNFLIFFHWEVVDVSICSSLKSLEQFLLNVLHLQIPRFQSWSTSKIHFFSQQPSAKTTLFSQFDPKHFQSQTSPQFPFFQENHNRQEEKSGITFSRRAVISAFASWRGFLCTCLAGIVTIFGLLANTHNTSAPMMWMHHGSQNWSGH